MFAQGKRTIRAARIMKRSALFSIVIAAPFFLTACGGISKSKKAVVWQGNQGAAGMDKGGAMKKAKEFDHKHHTEQYDRIVENPFLLAAKNPLSTFSIDVDTASYSNVRRFLNDKQLPPKDAVRIEELINYFDYDYPQPQREHPVAITTEVAACPWNTELKLVRIGLQAKFIPPDQLPPRNIVFLLDTSGSMSSANKLPLLKQALQLLVKQLDARDRVAIVAYAGSAGLVLPATPGNQRNTIIAALDRLQSGGSTNGGQGIQLAYRVAQESFIKDGVNRVIIGSDGDFNVGVTSRGDLTRLIEVKRKSGIYLSVLGFGMGNFKDTTMEELAHHGNGHYAYIDSIAEAEKIFVEQGGAMYTLANDVKIQVEFNPAKVLAYRLVGYENRLMRNEDFNDDSKDAGDLGSGHSVTAFYVVAPPGAKIDIPTVDPLKYQTENKLTKAAKGAELLTVKLRYKHPGAATSKLLVQPVDDSMQKFVDASTEFRFAAAIAEFGMLLRDSKYKGSANYDHVIRAAQRARGQDQRGHRVAFVEMAQIAQQLSERARQQ